MSGRIKVLIAEADTAAAARLTDALSACGWEVAQTRDAVSATAAALRHRPGAAIFNSQLPGGGGLLALKRIRASVHTTMTPVIVIAGKDAEQFYQHGADHCLAPPPRSGGRYRLAPEAPVRAERRDGSPGRPYRRAGEADCPG